MKSLFFFNKKIGLRNSYGGPNPLLDYLFFRKRTHDGGEEHLRKKCLFSLYHIAVDRGT
jgi:hypothetical protein